MSSILPHQNDRPGLPGADGELLRQFHLPLENLEFTLDNYLEQQGAGLDPETCILLTRLRDSIGQLARNSRKISRAA